MEAMLTRTFLFTHQSSDRQTDTEGRWCWLAGDCYKAADWATVCLDTDHGDARLPPFILDRGPAIMFLEPIRNMLASVLFAMNHLSISPRKI
jgi:hypothetical protein